MPLYEFRCESCGHLLETILAFSDPLPSTCEACGGPLKKLLSAPAVQFKGSGWYLTDYGRSGSGGRPKDPEPSGETKSAAPKDGATTPAASPAGGSSAPASPAPKTGDA